MKSGADNSLEQETSTVTKELEELEEKRKIILRWKKKNWPRLKKYMERRRNPEVNGVCDAAYFELGKDPVS